MPEQPPDPLLPFLPPAFVAALATSTSSWVADAIHTAGVPDPAWTAALGGAKIDRPTFDLLRAGSMATDGVLTSGGVRYRLAHRVDDAMARWVEAVPLS